MPTPMIAEEAKKRTPLNEIARLLRNAHDVLALCHVNPDGDAIGSLLALKWLLQALPSAPQVTAVCADPVPDALQFLPGAEGILSRAPDRCWDAVVALDASDFARLGGALDPVLVDAVPLIVLDHHVTNLHFGAFNYVDPEAAATAQIVIDLADALSIAIGGNAAVCLLTGLVTDTLGFRTSNVSLRVMRAALRLVEAGASMPEITQRTLNNRALSIMRLWGAALSRLHFDRRVVWAEVTREMRTQAGVGGDEDGGLVSHLITASEATVAAVFNELTDGRIEVDLRARPGYDVAAVALSVGGGGHPQASGCVLPGTLEQVEARLLPMLIRAAAP